MTCHSNKAMNETQIQAAAYQTLYNRHPLLRLCLFSVPNEALFSNLNNLGQDQKMSLISRFKASGLTPGVTDMIFYWQGKTYWLELKDDTGTVREEQKLFHRNLIIHNFDVQIYRSVEEIINKVEQIMKDHPLTQEQIDEKLALLKDMQALIQKKKARRH